MFVLISKVLSFCLAALAVSMSYVDFRARRESLQMFLLWTFTWAVIVGVALFPSIIDLLLGGSRAGIGTFLGMGGVFLFFLLYRVYVKLERVEQKMTALVHEIAVEEHKSRH